MGVYVLIGIVFGIYFVTKGITRLDKEAAGSPWHFRLMVYPGAVLLWSILLIKLVKSS